MKLLLILLTTIGACTSPVRTTPSDLEKMRAEFSVAAKISVLCEGGGVVTGSGFAVASRTVVTAGHVIDCDVLLVHVLDASGNSHPATVTRHDASVDVAVLTTTSDMPHFRAPRSLPLTKHDGFLSILGDASVCSVGGDSVAFLVRKCGHVMRTESDYVFTTIAAVPGNSGSAVWSGSGEIVGVITRGRWRADAEKYSAYVPYDKWRGLLAPMPGVGAVLVD